MSGPCSLHVISSLRLSAGGPTQSVTQLCQALHQLGAPAEIATVAGPDESTAVPSSVPVHAFPLQAPARLRRSPALAAFLRREATRFDLIHVHGLWEWPGRYARLAAHSAHRPLVISPRGMLEAWSLQQNPAMKRLAMALWERRNLASAALLHATSEAEAGQFRSLGLGNPIAVVPNGMDLPEFMPDARLTVGTPMALFLSRLHPKKGADLLLKAWAAAAPVSWRLVLAGPDPEGYQSHLEALASALGIRDQVDFPGPHYGAAKWALIRQSRLFILPSHSENFGNVVVEALSQGVPVITTRGTPWQELVDRQCGWWVPATLEGLSQALQAAMSLSAETLASMGLRGQHWARTSFSAEATARRMLQHYEGLPFPGPRHP